MRKISKKQMPLMPPKIDHPQAQELNSITTSILIKSYSYSSLNLSKDSDIIACALSL
jgi:hypothetical protein